MRYINKIIKEKGKSKHEILLEFDREILLAIIFVIVLSILLFAGREFIIPFFELCKDTIR